MMSSPLDMTPLDSSMPMVWASDGEFGSGGTLGARFVEDWLACERLSGEGAAGGPAVDGDGLFCWPRGLLDPPRKRAFL